MRNFPLIVNVPKRRTRKNPNPVKVLHISREGWEGLGARTECGRELGYTVTREFPVSHFEAVGEDLMVEPEYEFEGTFKLCSRCGTREDFVKAIGEYHEGHAAATKKADEYHEAKRESVEKFKCAIRATIMATAMPEGAEDVQDSGWGIKFTLNGTPFLITPVEEECERLHKVAEEQVEWHSE